MKSVDYREFVGLDVAIQCRKARKAIRNTKKAIENLMQSRLRGAKFPRMLQSKCDEVMEELRAENFYGVVTLTEEIRASLDQVVTCEEATEAIRAAQYAIEHAMRSGPERGPRLQGFKFPKELQEKCNKVMAVFLRGDEYDEVVACAREIHSDLLTAEWKYFDTSVSHLEGWFVDLVGQGKGLRNKVLQEILAPLVKRMNRLRSVVHVEHDVVNMERVCGPYREARQAIEVCQQEINAKQVERAAVQGRDQKTVGKPVNSIGDLQENMRKRFSTACA